MEVRLCTALLVASHSQLEQLWELDQPAIGHGLARNATHGTAAASQPILPLGTFSQHLSPLRTQIHRSYIRFLANMLIPNYFRHRGGTDFRPAISEIQTLHPMDGATSRGCNRPIGAIAPSERPAGQPITCFHAIRVFLLDIPMTHELLYAEMPSGICPLNLR